MGVIRYCSGSCGHCVSEGFVLIHRLYKSKHIHISTMCDIPTFPLDIAPPVDAKKISVRRARDVVEPISDRKRIYLKFSYTSDTNKTRHRKQKTIPVLCDNISTFSNTSSYWFTDKQRDMLRQASICLRKADETNLYFDLTDPKDRPYDKPDGTIDFEAHRVHEDEAKSFTRALLVLLSVMRSGPDLLYQFDNFVKTSEQFRTTFGTDERGLMFLNSRLLSIEYKELDYDSTDHTSFSSWVSRDNDYLVTMPFRAVQSEFIAFNSIFGLDSMLGTHNRSGWMPSENAIEFVIRSGLNSVYGHEWFNFRKNWLRSDDCNPDLDKFYERCQQKQRDAMLKNFRTENHGTDDTDPIKPTNFGSTSNQIKLMFLDDAGAYVAEYYEEEKEEEQVTIEGKRRKREEEQTKDDAFAANVLSDCKRRKFDEIAAIEPEHFWKAVCKSVHK